MDQKQVTVVHSQPVIPFSDIERMAVAFAKSGLFGIKNQDQAVALMLIAQAQGMHPAIAAQDYHIVQGRPALKSDAMLARFQQAGGKVQWNTLTDQEVSATFTHPAGGSATIAWTIAQAKAANLTSKDVWKQYPRAMLRARVISEGIRTVYPGVSVGVYTPEEIADFDTKPEPKAVQAEVVAPPSREHERDGLMKRLAACTWSRDDLKYYCGVAFGIQASKDLTIEQLEQFVKTVESADYKTAINAYNESL
jgi:hypothetical protein